MAVLCSLKNNKTRKEEEKIMIQKNIFKVEEGVAFIVTTQSKNIEELRLASEKYSVKLPDARFIIIHTKEMFEFYYELEGYGVTEYAFGLPDQQVQNGDADRIREFALTTLANNVDNISWSSILKEYLAEKGIDYEGE